MRKCEKCGGPMPIENRRGPRRKKCETCSPSRPRKKPAPEFPVTPVVPVGNVLDATRAELTASGQIHTSMGQTALALALRIDSGDEKGAGLASLAKQLQQVMMAAAPKQAEGPDPLQKLLERDELAQRRERRSS